MALGLGGGDVTAHPESGAPTLAIVGAHASALRVCAGYGAPTEHPGGTRQGEPRGFNINAARSIRKG